LVVVHPGEDDVIQRRDGSPTQSGEPSRSGIRFGDKAVLEVFPGPRIADSPRNWGKGMTEQRESENG
jgi:hypothetical protein